MTSLFDGPDWPAARGSAMPVDLISSGARGVSLLEFFAVEEEVDSQVEIEDDQQIPIDSADLIAKESALKTSAMIDAARSAASADTRRACEEEFALKIAAERERVDRACTEFSRDRQRYFASAEAQVVKLAIAIARRVLAKEVAADPMHLTGVVRAALARVQDGSATVLRVRHEDVATWSETFRTACDGNVSVAGDDRLAEGECVLETDVGRVELGVQVQLAEIERGFGELTQRHGE